MSQFDHGVRLTWGPDLDTVSQWDNVIDWTVETFGFPGQAWACSTNISDMEFWFKQPRDRTLFVLKLGSDRCTMLS